MSQKAFRFADSVVVITGGSSGIGRQVARDLVARGSRVALCGIDASAVEDTGRELTALGGEVEAVVCDVRDDEQVERFAARVIGRWGPPDVLINNAGYAVYRPFEESSVSELIDIVDVNLAGAIRCTKAFLPAMKKRRSGHIVNVSSIGGALIVTPNAAYCAAKHGLVALSKAIRYELAPFNISVNVVCPDHVVTNFHNHPTFRRRDRFRGGDVARKLGGRLTLEEMSKQLLMAIARDRAVTYVPRRLGLLVWALQGLAPLTQPMWDRVIRRRVRQLYSAIEMENRAHPTSD